MWLQWGFKGWLELRFIGKPFIILPYFIRFRELCMKTASLPDLPFPLFSRTQVSALEQTAIQQQGIPGIQLMKRAGRACFECLLEHYPSPEKISVFCGSGNNAGDGYVLAALAASRKIPVEIVQIGHQDSLSEDAKAALEFARSASVPIVSESELGAGVIVDGLLGTGYQSGTLKPDYQRAIEQMNQSGLPILAIDVPSGLNVDSGAADAIAVQARHTVTFIGLKPGLLTGRGPALCGEIHFDSLGLDAAIIDESEAALTRLALANEIKALSLRDADAHKGAFGHVMVIGGDSGMGGAPLMAVEAASRVGAGLVSVATRPEHVAAILARRPEAMVSGVPSGQALEPLLERPSVLVVGPGMGRSAWSEQVLQQALKTGLPLVVDADALNIISEGRVMPKAHRDNWILTPHPGEAARLLGCSTADIQNDRMKAVTDIQKQYGGVCVLKGAGTLIAGPAGPLTLSDSGNAGMASGGMGDVLSGILGGLLAQHLELDSAARLGVGLHGAAGDRVASQSGQHGMLASDLVPAVHFIVNELLAEQNNA
jgi:NAD(P)H-hydrate epimerase